MKPKVAVILPLHNSINHLAIMIKSLYDSTNFPFKLIILNAESTDGTRVFVENLKEEKDNVEVYHIKKKTLPYAINYGIKKAGDLDCYITQDDVIHFRLYGRDWLMEMYDLAKNENVGVITDLGGGGVSGNDYINGMKWVGTWSMYLPRHAIKKVGLLDEFMGPGDDIDYCYRIGKAKMVGKIVSYWTQHHRLTDHEDADSKLKQDKMAKYFRKKWKLGEFK